MSCRVPTKTSVTPGPEDRRATSALDRADERRPLLEILGADESRAVPQASAPEPREQQRDPPVGPISYDATGRRHRPIDEPVFVKGTEQLRHEAVDRRHRHVVLHRDHRGHADLREPRSDARQRTAGDGCVPARALARSQHHQLRKCLQVAEALDELLRGNAIGKPGVVLQEELGLTVDDEAVRNEVEDVAPLAHRGDDRGECGARLTADLDNRRVAERGTRSRELGARVDRWKRLAAGARTARYPSGRRRRRPPATCPWNARPLVACRHC